MKPARPLPDDDLTRVLAHTRELWETLRGERLFITGGTGFFGCWLLETLACANSRLNAGVSAAVLTRDPQAFRTRAPHLADAPGIELLAGDVRSFEFPPGAFAAVVHAANDPAAGPGSGNALLGYDTIVNGTRRVLDFAVESGAKDVLLTSSGAVYGTQPPELLHVPEDYPGAPSPASAASVYAEGKRCAELLAALYAERHGLRPKIARCFAFVGPHLPLDANFAAGNFLRDALAGGPIQVSGDGTPYRSYLYAADLAIWLWTVLLRGEACRPYNVGSDVAVSIRELAGLVAEQFDPLREVRVALEPTPGRPAARYVPDVSRAREELGLEVWVELEESLQRTMQWHSI